MPRPPTANRDNTLDQTRRRLLETASAEFARKGFADANINSISTTAGFAKGTIYNYFPSKRELMLTLIDEIAGCHMRFISEHVSPEKDPVRRLKQFFSAGFTFVEVYPSQAQVAINIVYGHDDEFKERIYKAYGELFSLITEDIVKAGIDQGVFKATDPDLAAGLLMSVYLGSSSQLDPDGKVWFDPNQVAAFVLDGMRKLDVDSGDEK